MNYSKLKRLVNRAMGRITVSRIRTAEINVATLATTGVVTSLLLADDDPDYDILTDGTTIAEVQARSKIIKIDLTIFFYTASDAGKLVEIGLFRDPDNGSLIGTTADDLSAKLFNPDYTAGLSEAKKNILFYRAFISDSSRAAKVIRVKIRRKAMARAGVLNDNDRLKLVFNSSGNITAGTCRVIGRIYTSMP